MTIELIESNELENNPGDLRDVFDKLIEEMSEVIQVLSKAKSYGLIDAYSGITNREHLETEIGDTLCIVDILLDNNIINRDAVNKSKIAKAIKMKKWAPTVAKYCKE